MGWRIWFKTFLDGRFIGSGVTTTDYKYKANAVRRAKQLFGNDIYGHRGVLHREWIVSKTNPFISTPEPELEGQMTFDI